MAIVPAQENSTEAIRRLCPTDAMWLSRNDSGTAVSENKTMGNDTAQSKSFLMRMIVISAKTTVIDTAAAIKTGGFSAR